MNDLVRFVGGILLGGCSVLTATAAVKLFLLILGNPR